MNEENLKNNVVIPFLNSIGFKEPQLTFEDNFTIKLGKNIIKKKEYISGRLDILVKLDNNPFLLWELKKEDLSITEEDVNQAISYARLTDPMTPFTIVSNGKNTKIYNTYDKTLINKNEIDKNYKTPSFSEAIKYRLEALSEIICYSKENLINFLNGINNRELERVKGDKYIKELYVERKEIHKEFKLFLTDNNKLFYITGESGIGKTNVMCNLLETNMEKSMILFYNACFINGSIVTQIMDDFNLGFDEQLVNRQLFNRINSLAKRENKHFIVFIDAIDELAIQNPTIEIDKLLKVVLEYSNIKICLSCKESFVDTYEKINGVSSILKSIVKINAKLSDFDNLEKDQIIQKYKKFYNVSFDEEIAKELKECCDNGFLFRAIFETYKNKTINEKIEDISIMEKYIKVISNNYNINYKDLLFTLNTIGEGFIKKKDDWPRLLIDENTIDNMLRIKQCKITVDVLINMNVLQRYLGDGITCIDFNFKPLSYYVIVIIYSGLNKKRGKEFKKALFELNNNRRSKEALVWYDKYIENFQYKDVFDFKKEYGSKLINQYRDIINKHFSSIKDKFELNEDINKIGIAIDNGFSCVIDSYGFYKKCNIKDDVRLIDFREENFLMKNGMISHSYTTSLINIERIVKDKLKKIIENKQLSEDSCLYLNMEYILNMIFLFGKVYDFDCKFEKPNFIPNFKEFLPLNLEELIEKIIKLNIRWLKQMELIDKELDDGKLYNELMQRKIDIPECNYAIAGKGRVPIYALVNRMLILINNFHITTINEPHILLPKDLNKPKSATWVADIILETFTQEELVAYLKDLLKKYIDEYITIVEDNFPTLKDKMAYYNLFKNGVILDLYVCKREKSLMGSYTKRLAYCYNDKSTSNEIIVNICDEKDMPKKPIYRYCSYISGEISALFLDNYVNSSLSRHMVLSNMIYSLIESDIKDLMESDEDIFSNFNIENEE